MPNQVQGRVFVSHPLVVKGPPNVHVVGDVDVAVKMSTRDGRSGIAHPLYWLQLVTQFSDHAGLTGGNSAATAGGRSPVKWLPPKRAVLQGMQRGCISHSGDGVHLARATLRNYYVCPVTDFQFGQR